MRASKREILFVCALIIVMVSTGIIIGGQSRDLKSANFEVSFLTQEVKQFQTKSGKQAARIETLEGTVEDLEKVYSDSLESLVKDLNIKTKRIEGLINTTTQTEVTFEGKQDSTGNIVQHNRWFDITVGCSKGVVSGKFVVRDSLTFIRYQKGKWYQKKTLVMYGVSHNPSTQITGLTNIEIKEDPNKWAVVAGVGVTYINGKIQPIGSVTFGRVLIKR